MAKFIPYDYNQHAMVVVNFQDQIQAGTFEYALHFLIEEKLDLSVFDSEYNNDDNGRLAYDPAITTALQQSIANIRSSSPRKRSAKARNNTACNRC